MDSFDLKINNLLSVLSNLVNSASRPEPTSAEAVRMSKVPTALLYEARRALESWSDTEYNSNALLQACRRSLE
jgi:hypothetical protein